MLVGRLYSLQPVLEVNEGVLAGQAVVDRAPERDSRGRFRARRRRGAGEAPELEGSIGEGPNQTNYLDRSSVKILAKFRNFH